jgi:Cft2 family RNA processing exonuclease
MVESSLTVSLWPSGHVAGSLAALIERLTSKVVMHSRQRNS